MGSFGFFFCFCSYKENTISFACGGSLLFFVSFIADAASSILDNRMEPLEAVLRSNFWLSTHVLIITMSYSAFFLSFIVGDILAFQFLLGRKPRWMKEALWFSHPFFKNRGIAFSFRNHPGCYLGRLFLGRFWGWDPKEVWALVSLLGYFGFAACSSSRLGERFWLGFGFNCLLFF